MAKKPPIDPLTGPKLALTGQVVTMDDTFRTLDRGTVYIDLGGIVAVQDAAQPPPAGFEAHERGRRRRDDLPGPDRAPQPPGLQRAEPVARPAAFTNRGQWGGTPNTSVSSPVR